MSLSATLPTSGLRGTSTQQITDEQSLGLLAGSMNWFGTITPIALTPADDGSYRSIIDSLASAGADSITLPFSADALYAEIPAQVAAANPDLAGLTGLQALTFVAGYAASAGLSVTLEDVGAPSGSTTPSWFDPVATAQGSTDLVTVTTAAAATPALSVISTAAAPATEGDLQTISTNAATFTPSLLPAGYLTTNGNQIVSVSTGADVRIAAINWFGIEVNGQPTGLDSISYTTTMDQMKAEGFNTIRLPFSDQGLTDISGYLPYNPSLSYKTGQQIMDAIVAYAGQIGMKVILDHHRSADGSSGNSGGLWYDPYYIVPATATVPAHFQTQQDWVNGLVALANRYAGNSTVVGIDLSNEPFAGTWGGGGATDWVAAATIAGNAVLASNPHLLIVVEGAFYAGGYYTEYAENLLGVASTPVTLTTPNQLVYSPHVYPYSIDPNTSGQASEYMPYLAALFGYIYQNNIAPILVGEFGSTTSSHDLGWEANLAAYLNDPGGKPAGGQGISTAYWAWSNNFGTDNNGSIYIANKALLSAISANFYDATPNCFGPGTCIRTIRGDIPVEQLQVGDRVPTVVGGTAEPIRWIGRRQIDCATHPQPWLVQPVRVSRDAFTDGVPSRDLILSPEHAVHLDGVLIPVRCLVNDITVTQIAVDTITYYHVELQRHDVILAEGLAAETYLDTDDHAGFDNPAPDVPSLSRMPAAAIWAEHGCAALLDQGAIVEAARQRIAARAFMLSARLAAD